MSQGVWRCDSCHVNNDLDAATCRFCGRTAGGTTGEVSVVTHQPLPEVRRQQPNFVQSRYDRPTITLAPPAPPRPSPPPVKTVVTRPALPPALPARPGRPPTPPRPARRPRSRTRRRTAKKGSGCALLAVGVVAVGVGLSLIGGRTTPTTVATPCPQAVARWLPLGSVNSTLVASYETPLHFVTICQDGAGQLYYDGQGRGKPATDEFHISLRATRTPTGFEADNGGYRYLIDGAELVVTENGAGIGRWPLTATK
jgi:hypothetical protein